MSVSTADAESESNPHDPEERVQTAVRTFVFTDIVGSTSIKQQLGDREAVVLISRHHEVLRRLLARWPDAVEVNTTGDGFFLLFTRPSDAVLFALLLQAELAKFNGEAVLPLMDRVGIHCGEIILHPGDEGLRNLQGIQIDATSRVMSLAKGGQILLTRFAFDNARQMITAAEHAHLGTLAWTSHGHYIVKGVEDPMEICEVAERSRGELTPPTDSPKARRHQQADGTLVLGWRPATGESVPGTAWELERKLGEGGFGEVWLAGHRQLRQRRVFKFCFFADRARSLRREVTLFRVLAERVGDHPHIVRVQDVFLDTPPYFLSMDYVAGEDLSVWSTNQGDLLSVPEEVRLEIAAQIATALAAAHGAGILHRDVKPSNVLMGTAPDGALQCKLSDFGIGQVTSQEILCGLTGMGFTRTIVGAENSSATGTRLYMAPELVAGHPASPQSDIYSLGVILYQLLVGDLLRPLTMDWSRRIADPLLRADLENCFAGDPDERFRTADELASRLRSMPERRREQAEEEQALRVREKAAYRRGMYRTAAFASVIVAVVLVVAALAIFYAKRADESRKRSEAMLDFMLLDLRSRLERSGRRDVLFAVVEEVIRHQEQMKRSASTGDVREANAFILRGDVYLYRGELAPAEADYEAARIHLNRILVQTPGDLNAQRVHASLGYKLGDVRLMQLRREEAGELMATSAAAFEALLDRGASSPQLQRDAAMAFAKRAEFAAEPSEARSWVERSMKLRRSAASAEPSQLQWEFEAAQSLYILARSDLDAGRADEAARKCGESRKTIENLVLQAPGSAAWRHQLALLDLLDGDRHLLAEGRDAAPGLEALQAAEASIAGAVSTLESVAAIDPENVWWQLDLADAQRRLADVLSKSGETERAADYQRKAAFAFVRIASSHPNVPALAVPPEALVPVGSLPAPDAIDSDPGTPQEVPGGRDFSAPRRASIYAGFQAARCAG